MVKLTETQAVGLFDDVLIEHVLIEHALSGDREAVRVLAARYQVALEVIEDAEQERIAKERAN